MNGKRGSVAHRTVWQLPPRLTMLGVALLAALLAGCGGDDDGSPGPTTRVTRFSPPSTFENEQLGEGSGACALLREGEVEAVLGVPVSPGSGVRTKADESCSWRLQSATNYFVAVITKEEGAADFDRSSRELPNVEQLSGLGDRAFAASDTAYALKGDRLIIIQVLTTEPVPERKQAAVRLMQTAVNRG